LYSVSGPALICWSLASFCWKARSVHSNVMPGGSSRLASSSILASAWPVLMNCGSTTPFTSAAWDIW
jgi:hypothetical protein